jgi:putative FmdB family regulatory protein
LLALPCALRTARELTVPAYDYKCSDCSRVFEKTQRITEPAGATCPDCGSSQCSRLITGGTFHLKGGGWYVSDYGGKKSEPAAAAAADSAAAPTGACGSAACATACAGAGAAEA